MGGFIVLIIMILTVWSLLMSWLIKNAVGFDKLMGKLEDIENNLNQVLKELNKK